MGLIVLLVIIGGVIFFGVGIYNGLVAKRNRYKNAFAQIDVQLKQRYDLIPNLVEMVKGYMKHESQTLEAVIRARNSAVSACDRASKNVGDADSMKNLASAEAGLSQSLGKLFALQESYPDLKANQNMLQLQETLTTTENKISFARQAYNDEVMMYNTATEQFPGFLFAGMGGFTPASLLQATESEEERKAVKVSF